MTVRLINYGASLTSIIVPDSKGNLNDILLGFDDIEGYKKPENTFLGATLGRFANRIAGGKFVLISKNNAVPIEYYLNKNDGDNTLHGGYYSFGKVFWYECSSGSDDAVTLCYDSQDGESGFPGSVRASVTFTLNSKNELRIKYNADATNKPTPINMANHAYFNLAGHKAGSKELYEHVVSIVADKYTPVDENSIPTGEIKNVKGTPYDLRNWTTVGLAIALKLPNGYDTNFALSCWEKQSDEKIKKPCLAARIFHPDTKRVLSVITNQPGLQFYTANTLSVAGKEGVYYGKQSAFCMETQHFPDSVNHPNFPNTILNPGEIYSYESIYKFEIGKF
ncbi:hypothetical protein PGB90_005704 [Kerria lacca]